MSKEETKLLFITGDFPYSLKETFIETEILYLSEGFNDITIAPKEVAGNRRKVPKGIEIDDSYSKYFTKYGKIKSLFSFLFVKGVFVHLRLIYSVMALRRINSFVNDALATYSWLKSKSFSEPMIIYTYWFNGKTYGAQLFALGNKNIKVVSRGHRYDIYDYWFSPSFWPFRIESIKKITKLFLISDDGYAYLGRKYKHTNKYAISKLGVTDHGVIAQRSQDQVIRLVSVSGLVPVKRVGLIAEYLVSYAKQNPTIRIEWTHIGDGPLKGAISQYLEDNKQDNFNYHFKGQIKNGEVMGYYANNPVDLFVNMSTSEGIPVSIMEAQSCGIVCAATKVGGTAETVNNKIGFLMTPNPTYNQFAKIIDSFANKNNEISREEVKKFWNENFNANINYNQFVDSLKKL